METTEEIDFYDQIFFQEHNIDISVWNLEMSQIGYLRRVRFWGLFVSKKTPNNAVTSEVDCTHCAGQQTSKSHET